MPAKNRKTGALAKSIAETALGKSVEEELEEQLDDDTKAKLAGHSASDDEYLQSGEDDDADDWKLDFETMPSKASVLQRSALRTANAPELSTIGSDERYRGKKVSRKSADKERLEARNKSIAADEGEQATAELGFLFEGESDEDKDEDEVSDVDEDNENIEEKGFQMSNENETDYGAFGGGTSEEGSDSASDAESNSISGKNKDDETLSDHDFDDSKELSSIKIIDGKASAEYHKGLAIKSQILVWDRLLECRIQLQKVLQLIKKFPQYDTWPCLLYTSDAADE